MRRIAKAKNSSPDTERLAFIVAESKKAKAMYNCDNAPCDDIYPSKFECRLCCCDHVGQAMCDGCEQQCLPAMYVAERLEAEYA